MEITVETTVTLCIGGHYIKRHSGMKVDSDEWPDLMGGDLVVTKKNVDKVFGVLCGLTENATWDAIEKDIDTLDELT